MIGIKIFTSNLELKIWIIHTKNKSKNIPKSGCLRRIIPINTKIKTFIINERSFLVLNLDNKSELTTIKLGLIISDGWNEKPKNWIHLLAPFVSGKKIIVDKDKNNEKQKKNMLVKIKFLIERFDKKQIIKKPNKQKMRCFLKSKSYFSSMRVDALKTAKIPTNINNITETKINLSRLLKK